MAQAYDILVEGIQPFFDLEEIARKWRIRTGTEAPMDRLARLAEAAAEVAQPRAACLVCPVTALDDERVDVGGVTLTSALLRENIGLLERAFPYMATEGEAMAEWAASLPPEDQPLAGGFREIAVKSYEAMLEAAILKRFELRQVSSMKPGSIAPWPIAEQEPLFRLLDPIPKLLGVSLQPNNWMSPAYSVAGIFFQTEVKFYSCRYCPLENCPNRRAPGPGMAA